MARPRQEWATRVGFAAMYSLAVVARWPLRDVPPYGDEGTYYHLARSFGALPANVHVLISHPTLDLHQFVLMLPGWSLIMAPGAHFSFSAFRLEHLLLTSLLPLFATGWLRASGVRSVFAWSAGVALAVHPLLVAWGVLAHPDALMATLFLAALWARALRRPVLAAFLAVAAAWTKETALLGVAALGATALWEGRSRLQAGRLNASEWAWLGALVAAPVPFLLYLLRDGVFPGGPAAQSPQFFLSPLFGSWVLALVLMGGLATQASRRVACLGLLYPAAFLVYAVVLGRSVEVWYLVLPTALAVPSAAFVLDRTVRATTHRRRPAKVAAAIAAILLVAQAALPASGAKATMTDPIGHAVLPSVFELPDWERARGPDQREILRFLDAEAPRTLFLVDVYWSTALVPFAQRGSDLTVGYTHLPRNATLDRWVAAVEQSDFTIVAKWSPPLNIALRSVYADCARLENREFMVIAGSACAGRSDALASAAGEDAAPSNAK